MVTKESQGPWDLFSHSHEKKAMGEEEEMCERNTHDNKRESLVSSIF